MNHLNLLLSFSALAAIFILLGIILNDIHQVNFGIICLIIAFITLFIKKIHTTKYRRIL